MSQAQLYGLTPNGLSQPIAATESGELYVSYTERERNVMAYFVTTGIVNPYWYALIDLSDINNWPHDRTGRIDISLIEIIVDKDNTAAGAVHLGVVTRVGVDNGDVAVFATLPFHERTVQDSLILTGAYAPSQLKLGVIDGRLNKVVTNSIMVNVGDIKEGAMLPSYLGLNTVQPAVGDVLVFCQRDAGTFSTAVRLFYHGEHDAVG